MTAHAQVVVAAPHGHVSLGAQGLRVIVGHGELGGLAVHGLEHAVGVIALLRLDFRLKEFVVVKVGHCGRSWGQYKRGLLQGATYCCRG